MQMEMGNYKQKVKEKKKKRNSQYVLQLFFYRIDLRNIIILYKKNGLKINNVPLSESLSVLELANCTHVKWLRFTKNSFQYFPF